jgi:hypothetical protein
MPNIQKLSQIQLLRIGKVGKNSQGSFSDFIEKDSWIAFAFCGNENEWLLTQTSGDFECYSSAANFTVVLQDSLASINSEINSEIQHLLGLTILEMGEEVTTLKDQNGFVLDWETPIKGYTPCIFFAKEYFDSDSDVLLNVDYLELSFEGDKFSNIGELPFALYGFSGGVYGISRPMSMQ